MRYKSETRSLVARTRELLRDRDNTLQDIVHETGLNFYWLSQFSSGQSINSSADRVQFLYEYLTGSELKLE